MKGELLVFFVVICDDQGGYLVNCYNIVVREFSTVGVATITPQKVEHTVLASTCSLILYCY